MMLRAKLVVGIAGLAMGSVALAQNTPEIEPNETKALATPVLAPMAIGDTLTGNTTGSSTTVPGAASADTLRVRTAVDSLAIYRYRLVLSTTGTVGHAASIRGLNQVAAAAGPWAGTVGTAGVTDTTIQSSSTTTTPARFNQWYGFGKGEELYYRVTGTATTTADYVSTLERSTIVPVSLGNFNAGNISISAMNQGPVTGDTDFWVYDGNLDPIAGYGNDDNSINGGGTGVGLQGLLNRTYAPGTYYIAMTAFNLANNLGSPSDDDYRSGALLDFPNAVVQSSTTVGTVLNFTISDGVNTVPVLSTKAGPYDINWFTFTVPAPSSLALLGLGGLVIARRRRA